MADKQQVRLPRAAHGAIIISWFGTTDINSMNAWRLSQGLETTPGVSKYADKLSRNFVERHGENGPVRSLTDDMPAQKIFLLSSALYEPDAVAMKEWVARGTEAPIEIVNSGVEDPTDYEELLAFLDKFRLGKAKAEESNRMVFNLSPGTPAMQACTLLYAPLNFPSCRLYKTLRPEFVKEGGQCFVQVKVPYSTPFSLGSNPPLAGRSTAASRMLEESIRLYGPIRSVNILILGESGVGKTRFAYKFHRGCRQAFGRDEGKEGADRSFVVANCAELARGDGQMFRAELFGAKKGSYTGAVQDMPGLFGTAAMDRNGGTLFLDEVGEIPLEMQSVLLRALQEHRAQRLGDNATYDISKVRIIAATNRNLLDSVRKGSFREDLYYRLAMCPLKLPPLRDIARTDKAAFEGLLKSVLEQIAEREPLLKEHVRLSKDAVEFCRSYAWPGNVRELDHVLLLACNLARFHDKSMVTRDEIEAYASGVPGSAAPSLAAPPTDLEAWVDSHEKAFIETALSNSNGNASGAARSLGLTLSKFNTIRNRLGINNA